MKILYIVDPQNDFLDEGTLPVKGSRNKMFELASYLARIPENTYDKIIVSLDWHPFNHCSFKENGGVWPEHCVAFTNGALPYVILMNVFKNKYNHKDQVTFILKGECADEEEYSGVTETNLPCLLYSGIADKDTTIDICGIVGTVCVQNTIDGLINDANVNPSNINVLLDYTAQFDADSEKKFINWCNEKKVNY